jgi:hypothetical protein
MEVLFFYFVPDTTRKSKNLYNLLCIYPLSKIRVTNLLNIYFRVDNWEWLEYFMKEEVSFEVNIQQVINIVLIKKYNEHSAS